MKKLLILAFLIPFRAHALDMGIINADGLTGTVPNAALDNSSATKQGNTFNGANQLIKNDSSGKIPSSALPSTGSFTNLNAGHYQSTGTLVSRTGQFSGGTAGTILVASGSVSGDLDAFYIKNTAAASASNLASQVYDLNVTAGERDAIETSASFPVINAAFSSQWGIKTRTNGGALADAFIVRGSSAVVNAALCLNSAKVLAVCTSVVGVDGTCTCP